MIQSFKHRGLQKLYEGRTTKHVSPEHIDKLRDMRVTFRLEGGHAVEVDYLDYH